MFKQTPERDRRSQSSNITDAHRSEEKHLIWQLAEAIGLVVPERLGGILHGTHHRRRPTQQDLDIACWCRKVCL